MKKTAIYPGTFDPITFGHVDVIQKSLKLVDKLIVAISNGTEKNYLFSIDERIEIVNKALFSDLKFNKNKIKVISFNSLTTELCKKYKSNIILRGLRAASDFEYEFQLAGMNRKLNNKRLKGCRNNLCGYFRWLKQRSFFFIRRKNIYN